MNSLADMNKAMQYIEENLTSSVDYARVSQIAGCSEYHFRRLFSYLSGIPLSEYVRCRKLALAATMLHHGMKVIDCATLMGYDSADSFARAFQKMHGINPSEAKDRQCKLMAFPPMTFQLTIQGGSKMDYRIVHNPSFKVVGFKKRITLQFEGVNPQMDSLYEKLTPEIIAELKSLCDLDPQGIISVSAHFEDHTREETEVDQYIGVSTTQPAPAGYDVLEVPESDWGVFTAVGPFPETLQTLWARIYSEWLPSTDYELTHGPELLWHESPDLTKPDCKSEIWIPLTR